MVTIVVSECKVFLQQGLIVSNASVLIFWFEQASLEISLTSILINYKSLAKTNTCNHAWTTIKLGLRLEDYKIFMLHLPSNCSLTTWIARIKLLAPSLSDFGFVFSSLRGAFTFDLFCLGTNEVTSLFLTISLSAQKTYIYLIFVNLHSKC